MRILTSLLLFLVVLVGVSFAVLNPGSVTIHYWWAQKTLPLSMLTVLVFAAGCLFGLLISVLLQIGLRVRNYQLSQRVRVLDKEVRNLRAIPLQDKH